VLFTSHWQVELADLWLGLRANPAARLVHRVDGSAQDYGRADGPRIDAAQRAINRLADLTIFQSHYARQATLERFRAVVHDGPVIHNAVDVDLFRPDGERLPQFEPGRRQVISVSWSTNPRKGAAAVYACAQANPAVHFLLAGRFPEAPAQANLHTLGVLGRGDLATAMRSCDALLTFSENEACPNVVLEGLASGLPVLYKHSGATPEVVGDCGLAVEVDTFRAGLDQVLEPRADYAGNARRRALEQFHPEAVFGRYLGEIEAALARPTAVPAQERARQGRHYRPPLRWWLRRLRHRFDANA
jgi:glycosyltransferase involved in cell wall biosynthesis